MGGYAFYVWGAYLSTALIMLWEIVSLILLRRTQKRDGVSPDFDHR
jgi:heme exporter protein CcmD